MKSADHLIGMESLSLSAATKVKRLLDTQWLMRLLKVYSQNIVQKLQALNKILKMKF